MKTLSDYIGKELIFLQPSLMKRFFELRLEDKVIATVNYPKFLSTTAVSDGEFGKWEFYKKNFFSLNRLIKEETRELPIAEYEGKLIKHEGELKLPSGKILHFNYSLLKNSLFIKDKYQEVLVSGKKGIGIKAKISIAVEKRSELLDKYPWALLLWCLICIDSKNSGHG